MENNDHTIEFCLEVLTGLEKSNVEFNIDESDKSILNSIARQVFKSMALTDRQYALVKEKLQKYIPQLQAVGIDTNQVFNTLRQPLRNIDRSQYITIINDAPNTKLNRFSDNSKWIKVRFPFSKKNIALIEKVSRLSLVSYYHEKGTHDHYFKINEKIVFELIKNFKDKAFVIDEALLDFYNKISMINDNPSDYLPGVYNSQLKNMHVNAKEYLESNIGTVTESNLYLYKDRAMLFGINYFDDNALESSFKHTSQLTRKIAERNKTNILVKPSDYTLTDVLLSLTELNRFPLLILIDEKSAYDHLTATHKALQKVAKTENISVLFRLEGDTGVQYNDYIRDNNLNSLLDQTTQVVYINRNKLPKPLIKSGWKPSAVLNIQSIKPTSKISDWLNEFDLTIHFDETVSQLMKYEFSKIEPI